MILIETLDHFSVPFYMVLIFCWQHLLYVLEKIVSNVWLFILLVFTVAFLCLWARCRLLNCDKAAVYLLEDVLCKLWLNVTAHYRQKLIRLCMFGYFVQDFESKLIHELVKNIFVKSYQEWKVNVSQVYVQLWLLILILLKWNRHWV